MQCEVVAGERIYVRYGPSRSGGFPNCMALCGRMESTRKGALPAMRGASRPQQRQDGVCLCVSPDTRASIVRLMCGIAVVPPEYHGDINREAHIAGTRGTGLPRAACGRQRGRAQQCRAEALLRPPSFVKLPTLMPSNFGA